MRNTQERDHSLSPPPRHPTPTGVTERPARQDMRRRRDHCPPAPLRVHPSEQTLLPEKSQESPLPGSNSMDKERQVHESAPHTYNISVMRIHQIVAHDRPTILPSKSFGLWAGEVDGYKYGGRGARREGREEVEERRGDRGERRRKHGAHYARRIGAPVPADLYAAACSMRQMWKVPHAGRKELRCAAYDCTIRIRATTPLRDFSGRGRPRLTPCEHV
ncbi:hypothetical protein K438DRAFT_1780708 [Mycena galopus ATCC 62051]|nr:hypothetical protein K438DRAFT_1789648 [Mycena galopus ATCC 62051]KAF8146696.1 hypothetical protein K438DRAFT_1780708 [Mycena galopus ATCC 62051]